MNNTFLHVPAGRALHVPVGRALHVPVGRAFTARLARRKAAPYLSDGGYTFVELLVVVTILLILASAVMPLAQVTSQRQREAELRRTLREMRTAIDAFKNAVEQGRIPTTELKPGSEGYPPDLDTLVEGVSAANDATGRKLRFMRRIPIDPMTADMEWGLRSYQDSPTDNSWGGQNVFDVYTKSGGTGLDGTKYRDW